MSYYNIRYGVNISYGENGAVVYDFSKSKTYEIEKFECEILDCIDHGIDTESIYDKFPLNKTKDFLEKLIENELAYISDSYIPREISRPGLKGKSYTFDVYPLVRCFIEMPYKCNKGCEYCQMIKLFSCYSCTQAKEHNTPSTKDYISLLKELNIFHCKNYVFYGGDILGHWNEFKGLLDEVRKNDDKCNIYIILCDSNFSKTQEEFFNEKRIEVIINVKWPIKEDEINNKYIYNINIPVELYEDFKKTRNLLKLNYTYSIYSSSEMQFDYSKEGFFRPFKNIVYDWEMMKNTCLCGQLAFKSNKGIYICKDSNKMLAKLKKDGLYSFFIENKEYFSLWSYGTDCGLCKFRRSCMSCYAYNEIVEKEKVCVRSLKK